MPASSTSPATWPPATGIDAAVDGVKTIVHCAGSAKGDDRKARALVRAATRAGVPHLVYISVVGADRVPVVSGMDRAVFGYFAAKRAAEKVIAELGAALDHAARRRQFHDLTLTVVAQMAKLPMIPVPAGVRFQPVDSGEVAARLVELALGKPSGLVPDLAGPARVRNGRAGPQLPARHRPAAADHAGPASPAGRTGRSGPARTWLPTGPSATARGKSSWPGMSVGAEPSRSPDLDR